MLFLGGKESSTLKEISETLGKETIDLYTVMVLLMLPAFLFAMYEKDGMHLEDVLLHVIRVRWLRPPIRKYETENLYETEIFSKERDPVVKSKKEGVMPIGRKKD